MGYPSPKLPEINVSSQEVKEMDCKSYCELGMLQVRGWSIIRVRR